MNERNGSLREIKNDRFLKTNLFERTSKKLSFFLNERVFQMILKNDSFFCTE